MRQSKSESWRNPSHAAGKFFATSSFYIIPSCHARVGRHRHMKMDGVICGGLTSPTPSRLSTAIGAHHKKTCTRGYPTVRVKAHRTNSNNKMATIGLRSNMPKRGRTRRIGVKIGSVIWFIQVLMLTNIGCGLPPDNGTMNDRIERATMKKMKSVNMVFMMPAKAPLPYCWPNLTDFK